MPCPSHQCVPSLCSIAWSLSAQKKYWEICTKRLGLGLTTLDHLSPCLDQFPSLTIVLFEGFPYQKKEIQRCYRRLDNIKRRHLNIRAGLTIVKSGMYIFAAAWQSWGPAPLHYGSLYFGVFMGSLAKEILFDFSGEPSKLQKNDLYFHNQADKTLHLSPTCKIGEPSL